MNEWIAVYPSTTLTIGPGVMAAIAPLNVFVIPIVGSAVNVATIVPHYRPRYATFDTAFNAWLLAA